MDKSPELESTVYVSQVKRSTTLSPLVNKSSELGMLQLADPVEPALVKRVKRGAFDTASVDSSVWLMNMVYRSCVNIHLVHLTALLACPDRE